MKRFREDHFISSEALSRIAQEVNYNPRKTLEFEDFTDAKVKADELKASGATNIKLHKIKGVWTLSYEADFEDKIAQQTTDHQPQSPYAPKPPKFPRFKTKSPKLPEKMPRFKKTPAIPSSGTAPKRVSEKIEEFFQDNPKPSDKEFHEFAEGEGEEVDKMEEKAYEMAAEHSKEDGKVDKEKKPSGPSVDHGSELKNKFDVDLNKYKDQIPGGKADKKLPEDFPIDQLLKGIKIEMEHTDDPYKALEISIDHLTEADDYYDYLEKMEKEMGRNKEEKGKEDKDEDAKSE